MQTTCYFLLTYSIDEELKALLIHDLLPECLDKQLDQIFEVFSFSLTIGFSSVLPCSTTLSLPKNTIPLPAKAYWWNSQNL